MFEYDHVQDFAKVKGHNADNIVLLCPNHHRAKTSKKLSVHRIIEAQQRPYNLGRMQTGAFHIGASRHIQVILGSNFATATFPEHLGDYHVLWANGHSLLTISKDKGWLALSFTLTDGMGQTLLHVEKGELRVSTRVWDYSYEGTILRVYAGPRRLLLELDLSNERLLVATGAFLDENQDGFLIWGGCLDTLVNGVSYHKRINCSAADGYGAWALHNTQRNPHLFIPTGFGSSITI